MRTRRTVPTLMLALLIPLAMLAACSDDSSGPNGDAPLVGTWNATSFTATGFGDLIGLGLDVELTLTSNTYDIVVTGDQLGALCDTGTTCTVDGAYTATSTSITLDPGTEDESTFNYDIDGDEMTWSGEIDDTAITIEWEAD